MESEICQAKRGNEFSLRGQNSHNVSVWSFLKCPDSCVSLFPVGDRRFLASKHDLSPKNRGRSFIAKKKL